jgi:hypothetical protein
LRDDKRRQHRDPEPGQVDGAELDVQRVMNDWVQLRLVAEC